MSIADKVNAQVDTLNLNLGGSNQTNASPVRWFTASMTSWPSAAWSCTVKPLSPMTSIRALVGASIISSCRIQGEPWPNRL